MQATKEPVINIRGKRTNPLYKPTKNIYCKVVEVGDKNEKPCIAETDSDSEDSYDSYDSEDSNSEDSNSDNVNESENSSNISLWDFIKQISWFVKSDRIMDTIAPRRIYMNYSDNEQKSLLESFQKNMENLKNAFITTDSFKNASEEEQNAFLSHIIAMGETMFNSCLTDISFGLWILECGEYQDFTKVFE